MIRSAPSRRARRPCSIRATSSPAAAGSSSALARRLEYWAFAAVLASLRRTPLAVRSRLGALLCACFRSCRSHDLRKIAYRNLAMALPEADRPRITDGVFRSVARMLVAFSRFPICNKTNIRRVDSV